MPYRPEDLVKNSLDNIIARIDEKMKLEYPLDVYFPAEGLNHKQIEYIKGLYEGFGWEVGETNGTNEYGDEDDSTYLVFRPTRGEN